MGFNNEGKPDIRYSLIEGQTYNIGRVPSNEISIGNDVSISRVHGTINVEKNISDRGKLNRYKMIKLFVVYFIPHYLEIKIIQLF